MAGKLLIIGASSFVGGHLLRAVGPSAAIATHNGHPVPGTVAFDATRADVLALAPDPGAIEAAVLLLGDTNPDSCIADPRRSEALNVTAVTRLVDRLASAGVRIVFTSSEFVFDGAKGDYAEDDPAHPILLYGAQKRAVEEHIRRVTDDHAILRLAKVYGDDAGDGTLFSRAMRDVARGGTISCAADQRFSPVHVADVVAAIRAAAAGVLDGLVHVAGPVALSRLECLELVAAAARRVRPMRPEAEPVTLVPCSIDDFPLPERRPHDVSMRADRLIAATGRALRHPAETCRRLAGTLAHAA